MPYSLPLVVIDQEGASIEFKAPFKLLIGPLHAPKPRFRRALLGGIMLVRMPPSHFAEVRRLEFVGRGIRTESEDAAWGPTIPLGWDPAHNVTSTGSEPQKNSETTPTAHLNGVVAGMASAQALALASATPTVRTTGPAMHTT